MDDIYPAMKRGLSDYTKELAKNPNAVTWTERRELAKVLAGAMLSPEHRDDALGLITVLSKDPKAEVRKEVADRLELLPEPAFSRIAAHLSGDASFFVQKAVERSLQRKQKDATATERSQRSLSQVDEQLQMIEKFHGKLAAQRAKKLADKQFDVLVGETVHDMRNILSPLKSAVAALSAQIESGSPDQKSCRETLARMGDRVDYLRRFIDDMREYAQDCVPELHRVKVADVVAEAKATALEALRLEGRFNEAVVLAVDVPDRLRADLARYQIVGALVHLIKNAFESFEMVKKEDRELQITVSAVTKRKMLELSVEDSGPGIHADDLKEYIRFDPGLTTKKSYGTGFGLPTVAKYAKAHGGSVKIESELGKGTKITIVVPLEAEEE